MMSNSLRYATLRRLLYEAKPSIALGPSHSTRQKCRFSFSRYQKGIPLSASVSSFIRRKASLRRMLPVMVFCLLLLLLSVRNRYRTLSSSRDPSNNTEECSSILCVEERKVANRRCSSSRTLVELPKHPIAALHCLNASKHGYRDVLNCKTSTRKPSLLWTIPGTGNTWVRKLLEQATGVATGSVYNDTSLLDIFVGEGLCDDTTLCIKAHPTTHPFELVFDQAENFMLSSPMLTFRNSVTRSTSDALRRQTMFRSHCLHRSDSLRHGKSMLFMRAIIIDRNPLEAAFAEVQRLTIKRQGRGKGSHIGGLPKNFKRDVNARVWNSLCTDYLRIGSDYVLAWHSYFQFVQKFGREAVHLARYEDLRDHQKREGVLRNMVKFLDAELRTGSLECAFDRSEDSRIRREHEKGLNPRSRSGASGSGSSSHLTISEFLFSEFKGKPLIEWMWKIVGRVAETRGYQAPKSFRVPKYQSSNATEILEIDRVVGFPTSRWYDNEGNLAVLQSFGFDSSTHRSNRIVDSQKRVVSSEYLPCLKEASLVKRDGHIVLTFAGNPVGVGIDDRRSVFPVLLNSILWMHTSGVRELLVVCFDEEYNYILRAVGVNTCYLGLESQRNTKLSRHGHNRKVLSEMYSHRLAVIEAMLSAEIDIIHTDIDAVWTGNPLAVIGSYHESDKGRSDIVASRGTFPHKESVSWGGSTLCMGLISVRSTPGVRQVLRTARQTAYKYHGDDQIGLNRGLDQLGLVWFEKKQEVGEVILPSTSGISRVRVALLADDIVRRNCTSTHLPSALIMHCFKKHSTSSNDADTKEFMKQRGLWLLKEDWFEMLMSRKENNHTIDTLRIWTPA